MVSKNAAPPPPRPADAKKDDKKNDKDKKTDYAYEDISFVPVDRRPDADADFSRSFTVPAGAYDVYVVAKEPTPDKAPKNAPPPKVSVLKQTVDGAGFLERRAGDQLGDRRAAHRSAARAADAAAAGRSAVRARHDGNRAGRSRRSSRKKAELSTFMLIYNPKIDSANKPDVSVEYNFYQKAGGSRRSSSTRRTRRT